MVKKRFLNAICVLITAAVLGWPVSAAKKPSVNVVAGQSNGSGSSGSNARGNTEENANPGGTTALGLHCKSALLMEASTGTVLYENNAHEKLPPASITKVMTELLVLEAIENGSLKWDENVTCSAHAASMGGSDIWLKEGEQMSVKDLFKAMAVGSANDAAVALAERVSGTEQAFVNEMNEKAAELKMNDTHFVNTNGLDADGHLTSANDIALMSRELMKHTEIFDFCTIWMDSLRGSKTALYNTNKLIRFYSGANGLKTGSTGKAGYCISATAKRNGMQLIAVTMGSDTSDQRFDSARALLDYGFTNWSVYTPKLSAAKISVKVLKGVQSSVEAAAVKMQPVLLKRGNEKKVVQKVGVVSNVMAPVEKGQVLGQIYLSVDGKTVGSIPLVAKQSVGKMTLFKAFAMLFVSLVSG